MYDKQMAAKKATGTTLGLQGQAIGHNPSSSQFQTVPRKFLGSQMQQINEGLDCLFGHIEILETSLAPISDPLNCTNEISPGQVSEEPSYVARLDLIIDRIEMARKMIVSINDRVRV